MTPSQKKYSQYKKLIEDQLALLIRKKDPASLYEPAQYVLDAGGKRIRPLLVMLACEAVGGTAKQVPDPLARQRLIIHHQGPEVHGSLLSAASKGSRKTTRVPRPGAPRMSI